MAASKCASTEAYFKTYIRSSRAHSQPILCIKIVSLEREREKLKAPWEEEEEVSIFGSFGFLMS